MSDNIFGERFISNRIPAWHNLGRVATEPMGAMEALTEMGEPVTTLEPITTIVNGEVFELPNRVIMRHPTDDDPEYVPFGIVGNEYHLLLASDVCSVWDEFVAQPIETIAFLARGSNFFITSKLPAIDVKGDEVEMYLGATAPLDGSKMASTEVWPLRVVCANTLSMAQARAADAYRVIHDRNAKVKMGEWLLNMYQQAEANTALMKEAFEVLAGFKPNESQVTDTLKAAYPDPKLPRNNAPESVMKGRYKDWEWYKGRQEVFRKNALELFQGAGTGMATKAAGGTGWGLFNAVVETEDYRRGWNKDGEEAQRVAASAMMGERADNKRRAYSQLLAYVS